MTKKTIVIVSVLKPIDDTRMFEKLGLSLAQTSKYDINIIGFPSKNIPLDKNISFHPLPFFKRLSVKRIYSQWYTFKKLWKLRPSLLIVSTHELLLIGLLIKFFRGSRLIYDVRENYYANLIYNQDYFSFLKYPVAFFVRLLEVCTSPFIDFYMLAEKCYQRELIFTKNKSVVIENKFKNIGEGDVKKMPKEKKKIRLVYTGTIAKTYGVFEAIALAKKLHDINENIELKIIGYCANSITLDQVEKALKGVNYIELIGGVNKVPHVDIMEDILCADFAVVSYQYNRSTADRFPTKIYEYMACRVPMILTNNSEWVKYCDRVGACVSVDFKNYNAEEVLNIMQAKKFYTQDLPREIYWSYEEEKLLKLINEIF